MSFRFHSYAVALLVVGTMLHLSPGGVTLAAEAQQVAPNTLFPRDQNSGSSTSDLLGKLMPRRQSDGELVSKKAWDQDSVLKSRGSYQDNDAELASQHEANKQRIALKKRWHELVDELIDRSYPSASEKYQKKSDSQNAQKRKRWMPSHEGDEKIMIIMKKPPQDEDISARSNKNQMESELDGGVRFNNLIDNTSQQQPIHRRPVNMDEHARGVLDDKFGIMRESIFTTNNHLGFKGVPKFGSEEEY